MKLENFINEYNKIATDNLKRLYIKNNIKTNKYVNFVQKKNIAKNIVDATSHVVEKDGTITDIVKFDSVNRFVLVTMRLIELYTNIEIGESVVEAYDLLSKNNLIKVFINTNHPEDSIIPIDEYMEFNAIINMTLDDFNNNLSLNVLINNKHNDIKGKLLSLLDGILKSIENIDEATLINVVNMFDKLSN